MHSEASALPTLSFHPLTSDRWLDFETLFGKHGACSGCWCMYWRMTHAQFQRQTGDQNKEAMRTLVASGEVPGMLAYAGDAPVAWCSFGRREEFPALERSRKLKRVDDRPVWSVVCFYVARPFRRRGIMVPLLTEVVAYARKRGAEIVEGYPIDVQGKLTGYTGYTGVASAFRRAGFVEVLRRSEYHPIMRYQVTQPLAADRDALVEGDS